MQAMQRANDREPIGKNGAQHSDRLGVTVTNSVEARDDGFTRTFIIFGLIISPVYFLCST